MPATAIAERIGWDGSITWFRENVRKLRPEHRRPDPADRLVWGPGDAVQCDLWFPPKKIPLEDGTAVLPPVLVIVAAPWYNLSTGTPAIDGSHIDGNQHAMPPAQEAARGNSPNSTNAQSHALPLC